MKKQWRIILSLLIGLMIVIISILNIKNVPINLGFMRFEAPLILVIMLAALIGALCVSLVATGTIWSQKRQVKHLQKQLDDLDASFDEKVAAAKADLVKQYGAKEETVKSNTSMTDTQTFNIDTHG